MVIILSSGEGKIPRREHLIRGQKVKYKFLSRGEEKPPYTQREKQKPHVEQSSSKYMVSLGYNSRSTKLCPLGQILPAACFVCTKFIYHKVYFLALQKETLYPPAVTPHCLWSYPRPQTTTSQLYFLINCLLGHFLQMESYSVCDFYDWLLSLNIMHLRFTHVVARLSFFIPFYSFHWVAIPYFAYSFTTLMPVFVSSVFFFL